MNRVPTPAQVEFASLEATRVSLSIVFSTLPMWGLPADVGTSLFTGFASAQVGPLQVSKYHYLQCSRPRPSGDCHPRDYQRIALRNVRAPAHMRYCHLHHALGEYGFS